MAVAILKEITSTEEQAEQIELLAQLKARDIVASARKAAACSTEKSVEQAEQEGRNIIMASEEKAAGDIVDMNVKTRARCQEIKENSGKKLKNAVDYIVGRIVEQ